MARGAPSARFSGRAIGEVVLIDLEGGGRVVRGWGLLLESLDLEGIGFGVS